ncbi:ATP-dependent protease ATPase subunit HslU [bacterium]|nr:ATP-dependent protease ATPase subunit HslU [bacterium]
MKALTPRTIVTELDRYIVGQNAAKKAVAIAIRNRWRRQQLPPELRDEVTPKNIIMIGPTGVGKTEIARRLANLVKAPFLKIEASKFTEVGYVGRDVESMVRDLVEGAVNDVSAEEMVEVQAKADARARERVLDVLLPAGPTASIVAAPHGIGEIDSAESEMEQQYARARERLESQLREGKLDDRKISIVTDEKSMPSVEIFTNSGVEQMGFDFQNMFERMVPSRQVERTLTVAEALHVFAQQEAEQLIDREKVRQTALERVENAGMIFLDEIDKVAVTGGKGAGPDVSREGVQRDLLPIVEGATVVTRHGMVRTDHILFIAAGAFTVAKPTDLIPELQGRFPIRVELDSLGEAEFVRILTEPQNALTKQYLALLQTEGIKLFFTQDAIEAIAAIAAQVNQSTQNIGARRLHTVIEKLLEDVSFDAPDMEPQEISIDGDTVRDRLKEIVEDEDLSRYIL